MRETEDQNTLLLKQSTSCVKNPNTSKEFLANQNYINNVNICNALWSLRKSSH